MTRRKFLTVTGSVGFAVAATGHGGYAVAQEGTPVVPAGEAPALAEQVAAGSLPALADRLPKNPYVVTPLESVGTYGGQWRTALVGGSDGAWLEKTIGYDYLVRYTPDWSEVVPNIAESFEASDDARSYTFKLREGTRWSDGELFTADDVLFYVNDVQNHPDLTTGGSNPFSAERKDDLTFTITFENPNGLFLLEAASPLGSVWTQYPKHYLSQFHETYNTENLDQLVAEAGAENWVELFRTKGGTIPGTPYNALWQNADLPRLHAWKLVEPFGEVTRVRAVRNPYYWKVDTAGNQLPYIDEVVFDVLQDAEVLLLKAAAGEIDLHMRHINTNLNKPVLADAQEAGGYHFFDTPPSAMNTTNFNFNLTHKDPVMRELFRSKDFRIGMSHGVDRQAVIDTVFVGVGEPWQWSPRPESQWPNETLAKQYTEFDLDLANEFLDKVIPERGADGLRLRPDGQKLTIVVDFIQSQETADAVKLVTDTWKAELGIDVVASGSDRTLAVARVDTNESDCYVQGAAGGLQDAFFDGYAYLPMSIGSRWAPAWYTWYAQAASPQTPPEEPTEPAKRQLALFDELKQSADPAIRDDLFRQILDIAQQEFWGFGVNLWPTGYGIVPNSWRNVPDSMIAAYFYPAPGALYPEQFYIEE
jgi:peptide/nickel transport system substrate-binding protein